MLLDYKAMQVIIMKDTKSLNSTALNDIDSKIQHLFGLSSLEEFGRCSESELIDRFINNKIDYKDVDKKTKCFFENECKNVKGGFSGGIGCCIRVSQTEACTVSPEGKDEIQVFEGILSIDYPAGFFRALTRKIDSSGELLSLYEKNSLYFNMLDVGSESDIQKIMIQNKNLLYPTDRLRKIANNQVQQPLRALYDIWHDHFINIKKEERIEGEPAQQRSFKPLVLEKDYKKTMSILIRLIPLMDKDGSYKSQRQYNEERRKVHTWLLTYRKSGQTLFVPDSMDKKILGDKLFDELKRSAQTIVQLPSAVIALQAYIDNWPNCDADTLRISINKYAQVLKERIEKEKDQIMKGCAKAQIGSRECKKIAVTLVNSVCMFDVVLQEIFGHDAFGKPLKTSIKGSIFRQS